MIKHITDKMRLDFLEQKGAILCSPGTGRWLFLGIKRREATGSYCRQAIDAAIRGDKQIRSMEQFRKKYLPKIVVAQCPDGGPTSCMQCPKCGKHCLNE